MKKRVFLFLCLLLFFSGCSYVSSREVAGVTGLPSDRTLTIWALSDIQPKNVSQRSHFVKAISDVNANVRNVDFAIVAGDLVQKTTRESYGWYLDTRAGSYIKEWYEIAGNHDLKPDGGTLFRELINGDGHYSFTKGNVLFILMSDEQKGSPTEIGTDTFNWWKSLVEGNQDKIIVVVTHAPLEGSGIPFSNMRRRRITGSKRFREVLKRYKVDVWISGHNHVPHWFAGDVGAVDGLGGTVFVNVSAIRKEALGLKPSESRFITFVCGSDRVLIRSRNHTRGKYTAWLDRGYKLSKPFRCGVAGGE